MTDDDRDMANAALLLDANITERVQRVISESLLSGEMGAALTRAIRQIVINEIGAALTQLGTRLQPRTYYGTNTSGNLYW